MGREPENSKIENLQMFAKFDYYIHKYLRKFADFSDKLHFQKFTVICKLLQIFAKICTFVRKSDDVAKT